ncbi:MAG: DUF2807 domain-containing protein [Chloroflexi bacterium]|nr:DUF2807 domain-containing protein [Chloroflexota bacterium]
MAFLLIALILIVLIGVIVSSRLKAGRTAIPGSGNLISQIKPFDNFTRINVGNAFQVEISMAIRHSVAITADDNVIELIEVEKEGDTLRIGLETGDYDEVTLKVKIGLPELDGLLMTGATRGVLEGISSATDLSISLSGASSLEGQLEVRKGDFRLSGASRIKLSGSADSLSIRGSGASIFDLGEFAVSRGEVILSGASRATVRVGESLDRVDLSGASILSYTGEPEIKEVSTTGASSIERK